MDSKTSCFVFPLTTSLTFYQFGKYSIAVPCDNGKLGTVWETIFKSHPKYNHHKRSQNLLVIKEIQTNMSFHYTQ